MFVYLLLGGDDGVLEDGCQAGLRVLGHHQRLYHWVKVQDDKHVVDQSVWRKKTSYSFLPMYYCFMKDIGLLVEGDDGDNDGLGLDVFQVGLRQHSHSLAAAVLGEDERVAAQTHGAGLEAVPIDADGILTGLTRTLLCKTKAGHKG